MQKEKPVALSWKSAAEKYAVKFNSSIATSLLSNNTLGHPSNLPIQEKSSRFNYELLQHKRRNANKCLALAAKSLIYKKNP